MNEQDTPGGLRTARRTRGWSQPEAARELAALADRRGVPVAGSASLKTLLSRWENGHSQPEPHYRSLLEDLYGRSSVELGFTEPDTGGSAGTHGLLTGLAAAATLQRTGMSLWRQQLALAHQLDDEVGAAGAGELVRAQVEQLTEALLHTLPGPARAELAELLAAAAALAGAQELDRTRHDRAWRLFDRARTAAGEADRPASRLAAVAGQAAVLIDIGEAPTAVRLLEQTASVPCGPAQARLEGALAMATAAAGDARSSRQAIAAAERRLRLPRADIVRPGDGPAVELADVHRWHGRAMVTLGDPGAVEPLRRALDAGPRSARDRAAVHADLALTLHAARPAESASHARTARQLATGIGSERITARLATLSGGP